MLNVLFGIKNYVPYDCYETIFDIDYQKLYQSGKRVILIDIDNTIIPYDFDLPKEEHLKLISEIKKIGFQVIFLSNNHQERVKKIAQAFDVEAIYSACKPLKKGFRQALKLATFSSKKEVVTIGDQIMTDVLGSNRSGLEAILVKPIKRKNEKWYTKLNRKIENRIVRRMNKNYPEIVEKIRELRGEAVENKM
ncbi:MAG: YqeG family HAD IIIA-type phosphatase [Bacilli bacterium]|nr:YqeG family HAD IIIA-type phosphatase [Bacilli bacterium]